VEKVLSRFGFSVCQPTPMPYDPSVLLRKNQRIATYQLRYSQIIGSLMYLTSAMRPDISFVVRVLRYLKGTMSYDIHYTEYPRVIEGFCDANWISNADELYATSGCVLAWRWCCFLEVLQADCFNEVNYGSRTHSIRHHWR
jgi:hypothetical protein